MSKWKAIKDIFLRKISSLKKRLILEVRFIFIKLLVRLKLLFRNSAGAPTMSKGSNSIIVVAAASEDYAMQLAVMIHSVLQNIKSKRKIVMYVLESRMTKESKARIENSVNHDIFNIVWIAVEDSALRNAKLSHNISIETYYRLLIPMVMPIDVEKIIYLDCDLIVNHDIGDLWDLDVGDKHLLAVPEMGRGALYVSSLYALKHYKKLGLDPHSKFFNAGVLLVNLKNWREDNIVSQLIDYLDKSKDEVLWLDQDALNAVLAGKWAELDPGWNVLTQLFYQYFSWRESPFNKNTYKRLVLSPYIVHFNTQVKPWHKGNNHPYRDLFFYYLDKTTWKGWRP